jgi:hypothetical protein
MGKGDAPAGIEAVTPFLGNAHAACTEDEAAYLPHRTGTALVYAEVR